MLGLEGLRREVGLVCTTQLKEKQTKLGYVVYMTYMYYQYNYSYST